MKIVTREISEKKEFLPNEIQRIWSTVAAANFSSSLSDKSTGGLPWNLRRPTFIVGMNDSAFRTWSQLKWGNKFRIFSSTVHFETIYSLFQNFIIYFTFYVFFMNIIYIQNVKYKFIVYLFCSSAG